MDELCMRGCSDRNWRAGGEWGHSEVLERSVDCKVFQAGYWQVPQMIFALRIEWRHGSQEKVILVYSGHCGL